MYLLLTVCVCVCFLSHRLTGGLKALRDVVPGFFSHRNIELSKLNRFVRSVNGRNRHTWQRKSLLDSITQWIAKSPAYQLMTLPKVLQRMDLHSTAKKIQYMLTRLKKKVSRCQRTRESAGRFTDGLRE